MRLILGSALDSLASIHGCLMGLPTFAAVAITVVVASPLFVLLRR